MAEHLAERQQGLRDARLAPDRLSAIACAERGASAISAANFARGARAWRSARRSAPRGRRRPRRGPGSTVLPACRASRASTPCRSSARAAARSPGRRRAERDQRVRGDVRDQVVAGDQVAVGRVEEHRVRRASGPGGGGPRTCGRANSSSPPSCRTWPTGALPPQPRYPRVTAPSAVTTLGPIAVAAHQRLREHVVALGVALEVLDHRARGRPARRPRRPSGRRGCRRARGGRRAGG